MIKTGTVINYSLLWQMILDAPRNIIDMFKKEKVKSDVTFSASADELNNLPQRGTNNRFHFDKGQIPTFHQGVINPYLFYSGDKTYINIGTPVSPIYKELIQKDGEK